MILDNAAVLLPNDNVARQLGPEQDVPRSGRHPLADAEKKDPVAVLYGQIDPHDASPLPVGKHSCGGVHGA